jgi:PTS system N-acetylglucosamine-specific IIC component
MDSVTMAAAGNAIFNNLGLLFAIGVAVGLARENHGAAGLAAVVAYLVATEGAKVLITVPPGAVAGLAERARDLALSDYKAHEIGKLSVPVGILSGLISGALYNRFYNINLPSYLAFFGGRRFVPIVSGFAGLGLALLFGLSWQSLEAGMDVLSRAVLHAGGAGLFVYGVLNRVLIVTGLHHIINNIAWFLLGDYHGVTGDLKRFFAGDPSAGVFMAGFFPVMMFGLPAACLAMYHSALPERRRAVGGLLGSIALTSLLTGVTEPIEFTFMFLAPALYAVHALLTGAAFLIMDALHVRLGFGFSAGLFDYVLNYSRATRPLWLLPVGVGYFALYYLLFRFVIVRFNLKTPGRDAAEAAPPATAQASGAARAREWLTALGGADNLVTVDACTTRLRLQITSQERIDEARLKQLGARGLVRPAANALQVVVGATADQLAGEIRAAMPAGAAAAPASRAAVPAVGSAASGADAASLDAAALLAALGGADNVHSVAPAASRLRVSVGEATGVEAGRLKALGVRGVAFAAPGCVHLIVGPAAGATSAQLKRLLG